MIPLRTFIFCLSFLVANLNALAFTDTLEICPSNPAIQKVLYMCRDNLFVLYKSKQCFQKVISQWKKTSAYIDKKLKKTNLETSGSQNNFEVLTKKDLELMAKMVQKNKNLMEAAANQISNYSKVMINFDDAYDEATSPDCFNNAFNPMQKIIDTLDLESVRAGELIEQSLSYRDQVLGDSQNLAAISSNTNPITLENKKIDQPNNPKGLAKNSSGITADPVQKNKVLSKKKKKKTLAKNKKGQVAPASSVSKSLKKAKTSKP